MLIHYGGKCACCGEDRHNLLTIDHVNGGGAAHRRAEGTHTIYGWLKQNNFPKEGFRVLCFNCNCSRGAYGFCPHEQEEKKEI